jgi:hypothetical protein
MRGYTRNRIAENKTPLRSSCMHKLTCASPSPRVRARARARISNPRRSGRTDGNRGIAPTSSPCLDAFLRWRRTRPPPPPPLHNTWSYPRNMSHKPPGRKGPTNPRRPSRQRPACMLATWYGYQSLGLVLWPFSHVINISHSRSG